MLVDLEECQWHGPQGILPDASKEHCCGSVDTAAELAATVSPAVRAKYGARVDTLLFWRALGMAFSMRLTPGYDALFQPLARWEALAMWPAGEPHSTYGTATRIRGRAARSRCKRWVPSLRTQPTLFKFQVQTSSPNAKCASGVLDMNINSITKHKDAAGISWRRCWSTTRTSRMCTGNPDIPSQFGAYPNVTFLMYDKAAHDALDSAKKAPIYRELFTLAMGDVFFGTYLSNSDMMAMDLHLLRTGFCSELVMMEDWYHIEIGGFGHVIWNFMGDKWT